jgi:hypothetical protein
MESKNIKKAIREIAKSAGQSLEEAIIETWVHLTSDEVVTLAQTDKDELSPHRFAKILLLVIAGDKLDSEFNSESINGVLPKARRIVKKTHNR